MKKICLVLAVVLSVIFVSACSATGTSSSAAGGKNTTSSSNADSKSNAFSSSKSQQSSQASDSGTLGNYNVIIESARISKDYQSKGAIIVKYKFTNNGSDAASFLASLHPQIYQDGVQLENAIIMDDKTYNAEDSMKNIKSGVSIEVEEPYLLTSETSSVDVEVTELINFSGKKVVKTFDLSHLG